MKQQEGPICQSCGMLMGSIDCFGTNSDKTQNEDYCCHCFYGGEFTNINITLEEMIDLTASIMADKLKMPEEQTREMAQSLIPTLKRWKK